VSVTIDPGFVDRMAPNVALQFLDRVDRSPRNEAFRYPVVEGSGERWESVTWAEAGEQVARYAAGLLALGIEPEQRVGIASATRYEWILADLAIMCAAAATTTVYPSTNTEDTAYIIGDSECRVVFAEDEEQVAKLRDHKSVLPHLSKVVTFDPSTVSGQAAGDGDWVIGLEDLGALGDTYLAEHADVIRETAEKIRPDQLATLIYTSGTTGRPKGVRLTHRSWVYEGSAIEAQHILDESDLEFRWLPMAHSFGKVLMSTQMACGFACAIDGRVDKIVDNLGVVKPTFMGAAPRRASRRRSSSRRSRSASPTSGPRARAAAPAYSSARSAPCSTSWSSARSASASAAGCGSSSPAPRRSTRTSPSGSTPRAC
jgi:long-chain acyl-CoA synthetase